MKPIEAGAAARCCLIAFALVAISFGELGLFKIFHQANLGELDLATSQFFAGLTHWQAYQNRLLGPALVLAAGEALCRAGGSCRYEDGLLLYYFLAFLAVNATFFLLVRRIVAEDAAAMLLLLAFLGGQILFWDYWMYPWDPIELALFCVLVLGPLARPRGPLFYALLFLLWLPVKETALFVPLAMFLALLPLENPPRPNRAAIRAHGPILALGLAMLLIAAVFTKLARELLFVGSVLKDAPQPRTMFFGNFFAPVDNLLNLWRHLSDLAQGRLDYSSYVAVYAILLPLLLLALGLGLRRRRGDPALAGARKIYALGCLFWLCLYMSANLCEARVYPPLLAILAGLQLAWRPRVAT